MEKKKKAFTLAETLITLTILGVVAAITIPSLISRYTESANRTKVKKAMATYEEILNHMVIENGLKTNDAINENFLNNNCAKSREYFKIAENDNENPCRFKTSDGVWWDISDIKNPIIILDKNIRGNDKADFLENYAKNYEDENGKKIYAYAMLGRIDPKTGTLRINDKAYEDENQFGDYPTFMAKLYSFVNNTEDLDLKYAKACSNECDIMSYLGGGSSGCNKCSSDVNLFGYEGKIMWGEDGNHYKINIERPLSDGGIEKTIINSDFSYTGYQTYPTGEKDEDFKCGHIEVTSSGYDCTGDWESTTYYKNGKIRSTGKTNSDGTRCYKYYNEDGSFNYQDGNACED